MLDPSLIPALYDVLAVSRLKSVHAAARRLHKTPSAVSQQIRRIESHFQVNLFERAGRGIKLTSEGQAALAPVTRLFDEADSVFDLLSSLAGKAVTPVRVAVSDYLGKALLIPVLKDLASAPVRFEITTAHSIEAVRLVETGEADVGVVTTSRSRSELQTRELFVQPFFWVAPARKGVSQRIEDRLQSEPVLRLAPGSEGRRILDQLLDRYRLTPLSTIDVPSVSLLISYAAGGIGVGLAPAAGLFDTPPGKVTLTEADVPPFPVRLIMRSSYRPPEPVELFLKNLTAESELAARRIREFQGTLGKSPRKR